MMLSAQPRKPWLFASVLSGGLVACAFPNIGWDEFIWVAFLPLLMVMRHRPFGSGFVTGLIFYLPTLSWLNIVMTRYGGLPLAYAVPAHALLATYLALYFGAATWMSCHIERRLGWSAALWLPIVWVTLEWVRSFALTGFPWAAIGYTLHDRSIMIQSADLFGVYGLSFLILLANTTLASLVTRWRGAYRSYALWAQLFGLIALVTFQWGYGLSALESATVAQNSSPLRVAAIQGNIDQSVKWAPEYQQATVDQYLRLTREANTELPVDLVIWPEAAMPFYFQTPGNYKTRIEQLPQELGLSLLFGSPAYRRDAEGTTFFNSAYLLDSESRLLGRSDKAHLVPFGEYVPLSSILSFIDKLVVGVGDFSPGSVTPLDLNGTSLGVLVCYEAIFPELARDFVAKGAGLLINITNDAWFGRSAAPWQHLSMARFRAVENRVWLVRAANTGISAMISPTGEISAATDLFTEGYSLGEVIPDSRGSIYTQYGDLLPKAAAVLTALAFLISLAYRRKHRLID